MAAEAAGVEPELNTARERQLAYVQHGPLWADPAEPRADVVRRGRLHDRVVKWAPVSFQHHPVAGSEANAHLRQPRSGGVFGVHLQREHLPEPSRAAGVEAHVAARFELEAVQRRLEPEAAAINRGGKRKHRRLERRAGAAVLLDRSLHVAHALDPFTSLPLDRAAVPSLSPPAA